MDDDTTKALLATLNDIRLITASRGPNGFRIEAARTAWIDQKVAAAIGVVERSKNSEYGIQTYKNALWKACGDDEESVNAYLESQG